MSDGNSNVVAHSLRADGFDASEDGTGRGTPLVATPITSSYGKQPDNSDATPPNLIAYQCHGSNVGPMGTVRAGNGNETGGVPFTRDATGVRRLTPVECARLQGFPDTYLDIPYRGKPACDGPKYKALGNSMAVPVMRWIGERISGVESIRRTV